MRVVSVGDLVTDYYYKNGKLLGVNATTFGKFKATKEEWKEMLQDGLVYHKEGNAIMF